MESEAKIIFISNNTNKGGETNGYSILDFIQEIERYLGKSIDYIVANNNKLNLSSSDEKKLKNDISVKGGEHIFLSDSDREILIGRGG